MNIPEFPLLRHLDICDKQVFDDFQKEHRLGISEYTFANMYIWRKADKTQLTRINGNVCILAFAPDKEQYFMMPIGRKGLTATLEKCLTLSPKVIRLPEAMLKDIDTGRFCVTEDADNGDYIYLAKDLIELKGRKYDAKRNHLNHFLRNNSFVYERMTPSHTEECLCLNDLWCKEKKKESETFPNIECEGEVVKEALLNLARLDLTGGVIRVNGKIEAFAIGQQLTADTAVIHIEKADPAIRGMSQLINREFVKNEWADMTYINREQDMGHPGLRKAKLSYHPVRIEKKYSVYKADLTQQN